MITLRKTTLSFITAALILSISGCSQTSGSLTGTENTENTAEIPTPAEQTEVTPEPEPEPEPEVIIPETVSILGKEYNIDETSLDLSDMAPEDITEVSGIIADMPELEEVSLMPSEGEPLLSLEAVSALKEAAPDVHFVYEFDMFDQHLTTEDTEVSYVKAEIGNEGEETIRQALSIMDKCKYFLLDDCGIDDEVMAEIREDFPDTKVVWRVHVGWKSALTDDQPLKILQRSHIYGSRS